MSYLPSIGSQVLKSRVTKDGFINSEPLSHRRTPIELFWADDDETMSVLSQDGAGVEEIFSRDSLRTPQDTRRKIQAKNASDYARDFARVKSKMGVGFSVDNPPSTTYGLQVGGEMGWDDDSISDSSSVTSSPVRSRQPTPGHASGTTTASATRTSTSSRGNTPKDSKGTTSKSGPQSTDDKLREREAKREYMKSAKRKR